MRKIISCLLTVIMFFTQGCCSIFSSGPQSISIDSVPQGASVKVGPYDGTTPCNISVPRGKNYTISATYEDQTETKTLRKSIEGMYWANLLFLWPGLIIDAATGKMYKYDPDIYTFNFEQ